MPGANLKARNALQLTAFLVGNAWFILSVTLPNWTLPGLTSIASDSRLDEWLNRTGLATMATVALTVLNNLIPSDWKATLVFWRLKDVLPGHRAFTHFAQVDSRIDVQLLKARMGSWPTHPRDQNAAWYRFLKRHETVPQIGSGHRVFLLLRDGTALVLLLALATVGARLAGATWSTIAIAEVVLILEYLILVIAARNAANRLVSNVLAHECTQ